MIYNIIDFGAEAGGKTLCTAAIQKALDSCAEAGGGQVYVPAGKYLTGSILLRSRCELYLEKGAELLGSTNIADYRALPDSVYCISAYRYDIPGLIIADGIEDAGISGRGLINGNAAKAGGGERPFPNRDDPRRRRPFLIVYRDSRDMYLEDIRLKDPGVYAFYGIHCDGIDINNVEVRSWDCGNGDGLDFDGSRNVRITNCFLETGDDSISPKSLDPAYPCENFVISNCIMRSRWAAIRIGPESSADMRNITVTNCVFEDCNDGLKIQTCSGGVFEDLVFSGLTMRNVRRPVLMTLNYFRFGSKDPEIRPKGSVIRRVVIDGVTAFMPRENPLEQAYIVVSGMPQSPIRDISLNNLKVNFYGGGGAAEAERICVPELLDYTERYFEPRFFMGSLPAAGLYLRHIEGLQINNCAFTVENADVRPVIFGCDIPGASLVNVSGRGPAAALIWTALSGELIRRGCRFNNAAADEIPCTGEDRNAALAAYGDTVCGLEAVMDAWAAATDQAEACRLYRRFLPEDFVPRAGASGDTVIFPAKFSVTETGSRIWLYFPMARGDMEVRADGKVLGSHRLPADYQRRYSWALDMGLSQGDGEHTLEIEITMPGLPEKGLCIRGPDGKLYGLVFPPEIGVEDGGGRFAPGRVSPPPDIFGYH
jgi:hypothetical protein